MRLFLFLLALPFASTASTVYCGNIVGNFTGNKLLISSPKAATNGVNIKDLAFDKFKSEIKTPSYTVSLRNDRLYINGNLCKHSKKPLFTEFKPVGSK